MSKNTEMLIDAWIEQALAGAEASGGTTHDPAIAAEALAEVRAVSADTFVGQIELAAAAVLVAESAPQEPLPDSLRDKLLDDARTFATPASVTAISSRAPQPRSGWLQGAGWLAAATLFIALVWQSAEQTPPAIAEPTIAELREQLSTIDGTVTLTWGQSELSPFDGVRGDVVWNNERQQGFLRLVNMPANNPSVTQYQLWIVDPERDSNPIDGGVFNVIAASGEVLIPIDAKLPVIDAKAFAITEERPGGVVVSDGPLLLIAAS